MEQKKIIKTSPANTPLEKPEIRKTIPQQQVWNKMVLGRENYMLILLGVIVLIIGFILMSGGKYTDPNVFNGDELYSPRRITIAPIVVIIGFSIEVYAIFHKSRRDK